jgi:hypothetical protein
MARLVMAVIANDMPDIRMNKRSVNYVVWYFLYERV